MDWVVQPPDTTTGGGHELHFVLQWEKMSQIWGGQEHRFDLKLQLCSCMCPTTTPPAGLTRSTRWTHLNSQTERGRLCRTTAPHCSLMIRLKWIGSFSPLLRLEQHAHLEMPVWQRRRKTTSAKWHKEVQGAKKFHCVSCCAPDGFRVSRSSYWWRGLHCLECRPSGTVWSGWKAATGPASFHCHLHWKTEKKSTKEFNEEFIEKQQINDQESHS